MDATATTPLIGTAVEHNSRRFGKAAVAGLVGGVVGTAAKTVCEIISPPRPPGTLSPLGNGINAISNFFAGHVPTEAHLKTSEMLSHWGFGVGTGIAYALIAEVLPVATLGWGLAFGAVFWVVAHETVLPLIGWSPSPLSMSLWEQGNEFVSHLVYGVAVELTRRVVRRGL